MDSYPDISCEDFYCLGWFLELLIENENLRNEDARLESTIGQLSFADEVYNIRLYFSDYQKDERNRPHWDEQIKRTLRSLCEYADRFLPEKITS